MPHHRRRGGLAPAGARTPRGWYFLHRRKEEGRSYGNAALYATPQSIDSLVRETGQNSLDAAAGRKVAMRYRLIELPPGCGRRDRFMAALGFDTLRAHLTAVVEGKKSKTSSRLRSALRQLDEETRTIWLLAIEDYGTRGLTGDDFDPDGNFSALVRDVENSRKSTTTSGGSFGLGAKTLWSCSSLLTVVFGSILETRPDDTRVVAKADLGFHEIDSEAENGFVGPGLWGKRCAADAAESDWVPNDSDVLKDLCLFRESPAEAAGPWGTTALIVAFDDPTVDDESAPSILEALTTSVALSYWPAIANGTLEVFIRHEQGDQFQGAEDKRVDPKDFVPSFVEAFAKNTRGETSDALEVPGDVVSIPIPHGVPATRPDADIDHHPEALAEARLIIRLAEGSERDAHLIDHVAMARGRAMITRYWARKGIGLNARPFHAFLAAGTLAGEGEVQTFAETFLRDAEPPSHDQWELLAGLKALYVHGAGTKLKELHDRVTAALKRFVAAAPQSSDDLPEALRDIFRLRSTTVPNRSRYRLLSPSVTLRDRRYEVVATVEINPMSDALVLRPELSLASESGNALRIPWLELTVTEGAAAELSEGRLRIPRGLRRVTIRGTAAVPAAFVKPESLAVRVALPQTT